MKKRDTAKIIMSTPYPYNIFKVIYQLEPEECTPELRRKLLDFLDILSDYHREILLMRYCDRMTQKTIGEVKGCCGNNIKTSLDQAARRLRGEYRKQIAPIKGDEADGIPIDKKMMQKIEQRIKEVNKEANITEDMTWQV